MRMAQRKQSGFTLLEVMAASVITAFIAMVAISGLISVTSARKQIDEVTVVNDELRFVADCLRRDLAGFYRNKNEMLFEGSMEETNAGVFPKLRFRSICTNKTRIDQPEGDLYEVEYFLAAGDEGTPWIARRQCPIVGNEKTPEETAGGVMTRLAERLSLFQVRYFNGEQWQQEWPMELTQMPILVEISLGAKVEEKNDNVTVYAKQFFINFPRNGQEDEEIDMEMEAENPEETMSQS
ncbi:MAG: prepilin-type N-terminal cleavage/methylation domain-containing protein [Planctomycetota bacterium]